jgi:ABC-type multidrug transport system permease subunit
MAELNQYPGELESGLAELDARLAAGDQQAAIEQTQNLREMTEETRGGVVQSRRVLLASALSVGASGAPESPPIQNLEALELQLSEIHTGLTNVLTKVTTQNAGQEDIAGDVEFIEERRVAYAETAALLPAIPISVLVSPFVSSENNLAPTSPDFVDFYAPAVLALLIQHIAITLTALALVRERLTGTIEMFRIAPVSAREVLTGKYLSFFILGALLSAILALIIIYGLDVPLLGNEWDFVLVIALVLAASLGVGFLISSLASSETQAVQLAMILLLASVFFSGFFLPLDNLQAAVQLVAYILPVTYGISGLQEVMLRGVEPPLWTITGPAAIAVLTTLAASIAFSFQFRRR